MDAANPPSFTPQQLNQFELNPSKPPRLKALFLLKIGLFEIGFVSIFLFLIFFALNFFHILHIPFFPSSTPSQQALRPSPTVVITPNPHPGPPPAIGLFLVQTLQDAYLSSNKNSHHVAKKKTNNTYTTTWDNTKDAFSYTLLWNSTNTQPTEAKLIITAKSATPSASLNSQSTMQLINKYFLPLSDTSGLVCLSSSQCQLTITDATSKKIYGVKSNGTITVFACMMPTDSPLFTTSTSCD